MHSLNLLATLIVKLLQLLMHLAQLLKNRFGALETTEVQQHRFHSVLAVDQHAAFRGSWFVRHQAIH